MPVPAAVRQAVGTDIHPHFQAGLWCRRGAVAYHRLMSEENCQDTVTLVLTEKQRDALRRRTFWQRVKAFVLGPDFEERKRIFDETVRETKARAKQRPPASP